MPLHYHKGIPFKPSKIPDGVKKPLDKRPDCLSCMSGHSIFKKEKEKKKKILKDKDLFVMKGEKKSNNIIKKKRTNGKNIRNNKKKSVKPKTSVVKNLSKQVKEINGSDERKSRKFNRFIGKYKRNDRRS